MLQYNNYFVDENNQKNHLLKWFLLLFGNTGIQLERIDYHDRRCLIRTVVNILINIVVNLYYSLVAMPFWDYEAMKNAQKTPKSLNNFMTLFGNYYLDVFLFINPILFFTIGPSIGHLMASIHFKRIYCCHQKSLRVMSTIVLIIVLYCLEFTIFAGSLNMKKKRTQWTVVFEFFINYYICISFFIPGFTLNYVKFATIEMLRTTTTTNTRRECENIEKIIRKIGQIAEMNRKISHFLSPMITIFICSSVLDMIVLLMWFQDLGWSFFHTLLASLFTWFYLTYLIYLDNQIERIFSEKIYEMLSLKNDIFKCCGQCKQRLEYEYIHHCKRNNRSTPKTIQLFFCSHKQRLIECYRLYEKDFPYEFI
ncbi:uncharacterized protein LOC124490746 [Dermatophagoides farinae]|uniref:uncharacterized protein LOC124490746 n=1 Tax=Dermatophagoides farinae TaxID=6954 RepID=UPI003F63C5E2